MNQEHFFGESCKRGLEFLNMISEWLSTIFVNGNPQNVSHKQDESPTIGLCFWIT